MQESFEQQVIRNVQGKFSIYKTPEVIGDQTGIPNIEWADSENVDGFFKFAAHLGAKIVYLTEGEEEDDSGQVKKGIVQVGFLHQGIMHHINFADEDEDDEEEDDDEYEDDEEYEDEDDIEETSQTNQPNPDSSSQSNPQQQNFGM